ncbi:adhesive plaque matrix protein 2-like [Haliotis rufescens]|uniref:adhesive plaque matrix protein 2-like n=1 Tax=Haliotis rufescens TaxID=6454 RepID=UPI00201F8E5A|nr:adhesive plaque matrix protein 2-like [Haliotis rufescens]
MSGYGGDTCKLKDACAKNEDCLHSGTCNGTTTPKQCVCVNGYSGPTCQNGASVEKLSARLLAVVTVSILIKMQFMRDLP